jgi:hypothetical protein
MNEDASFLRFLINEDIYIIEEKKSASSVEAQEVPVSESSPDRQIKDKTVFILDYTDRSAIPEDHDAFLSKVIKSVNLNEKNVEILFEKECESLSQNNFENCFTLVFSSKVPKNLSALLNKNRYVIKTEGNNKFLLCDPLDVITSDTPLKRHLWEQLKAMFKIS